MKETKQERIQSALIYFSYAYQDRTFQKKLEDHLSILKYRGLITTWHAQEIRPGEEYTQQMRIHFVAAHIILLLISSSFLASDHCYGVEMPQALERHEQGIASVIPILLRPVHLAGAPFSKLRMLPSNKKPVASWRNRDQAYVDIALGIERVVEERFSPQTTSEKVQRVVRKAAEITLEFTGLVIVLGTLIGIITRPLPLNACCFDYDYWYKFLIISSIIAVLGLLIFLLGWLLNYRRTTYPRRRYYPQALYAYEQAIKNDPLDADAWRGKGQTLFAIKQYKKALEALRQAISLSPQPQAALYVNIGDVHTKLEQYDAALQMYEQALRLDQSCHLAYKGMQKVLGYLGRREEAHRVDERAKQLGFEE